MAFLSGSTNRTASPPRLRPPQKPPPQRGRARLAAQPLVAQHQLPARPRRHHAARVRVAATPGITFGRDEHMLAERGQMITTQRTAIGRRLAVRRTSNGPPWRGRQPAHGSIVAPLATTLVVTLAATAAVRAGVAIAIAERDRQATRRRRRRERQFGLLPGEGTVQGLRRMLLSQIDLATELLAAENGQIPTAEAVHDTRKALKRLRALVTLLEDELGAAASAREELALREAGRRLAGMRDTEV